MVLFGEASIKNDKNDKVCVSQRKGSRRSHNICSGRNLGCKSPEFRFCYRKTRPKKQQQAKQRRKHRCQKKRWY